MKEYSKELGTAAVAVGGVLYVVLTYITRWVYEPLGVTPSEVGLGYGPLLLGAAVALLLFILVSFGYGGLAFGIFWVAAKRAPKSRRARWVRGVVLALVAVALSVVDPVLMLTAPLFLAAAAGVIWGVSSGSVATVIAILSVLIVVMIGWVVQMQAEQVRLALRYGKASGHGIFFSPWDARVAKVTWTSSKPPAPRLPPCLLYLGEANGMSVFFDPGPPLDDFFGPGPPDKPFDPAQARTLRLPTSSVAIEILPQHDFAAGYPIEYPSGSDADQKKKYRESIISDDPCYQE